MEWYVSVLKQYATFSGRARRQEYWMFFLFNLLVGIGVGILDQILGTAGESGGLLGSLYSLAVLLPSLAVGVRRLHDTGRSGWWMFIALVPLVGGIILLVFMAAEGTPGPNEFGPDPKAAGVAPQYTQAYNAAVPPVRVPVPPVAYAPTPAATVAPAAYEPTPATPAVSATSAVPAGWHVDPSGRHQHRYWDGAKWTEHVSDNGVTGIDAV